MLTNKETEKPKEIEIEVFKTGENTDNEGEKRYWTDEDLQTIATIYNDKIKEDPGAQAPIVKGHPETDAPALGWVEKLRVAGDTLMAKIKLVPTFAQEVKDEMFKKVSIALYPDLMLRHIGFLGAAQPAVKGLEPVKFNDMKKGYITLKHKIETADEYFKRKRELKFAEEHVDVDPSKLTKSQLATIIIQNMVKKQEQEKRGGNEMEIFGLWFKIFVEAMTDKLDIELSTEISVQFQAWVDEYVANNPLPSDDKADTEGLPNAYSSIFNDSSMAKEFIKKITQLEKKNRQHEFNEYYEGLLKEGKVVPAQKDLLMNVLEMVHGKEGFEFAENGKSIKLNAEDAVKKVISSFPKQVEYNEQAVDGKGEEKKHSDYVVPEGTIVDEDRLQVHQKALQYMEDQIKGGKPAVSYIYAVEQVSK